MHSDKTLIKHRKRNFNALLLQVKKRELDKDNVVEEKPKPEQERIDRKLKKHRIKYVSNKLTKTEPWGKLEAAQCRSLECPSNKFSF